jgi:hypothetical protein
MRTGDDPSCAARRELLEDMRGLLHQDVTLENQLQAPGAVGLSLRSEKLRCQPHPAPRNEHVLGLSQRTENPLRMVCLRVRKA